MLASTTGRRLIGTRSSSVVIRSLSTKATKFGDSPIGTDGRHEIWREGIYDHDNTPK